VYGDSQERRPSLKDEDMHRCKAMMFTMLLIPLLLLLLLRQVAELVWSGWWLRSFGRGGGWVGWLYLKKLSNNNVLEEAGLGLGT
jgi:hypothetical protein